METTMNWSLKKKRVLVPYDFSPACQAALAVARTFVDSEDQLTAMYVVPEAPAALPHMSWSIEEMRKSADASLAAELVERGFPRARRHIASGSAAEALVEYAESEEDIELIVIAKHERGGFERWFLGSVAQRVIRTSPVPVLVFDTALDD